jgi:putative flippase GtrA
MQLPCGSGFHLGNFSNEGAVGLRTFLKFNLVGMLNTLVDIIVFSLLVYIYIPAGWAQAIGYSCGIFNSFIWNRNWTFDHKEAQIGGAPFWKFVLSNLVVIGVSTLWVVGVTEYGFSNLIAKVSSFGLTLPLSYLASRWALRRIQKHR